MKRRVTTPLQAAALAALLGLSSVLPLTSAKAQWASSESGDFLAGMAAMEKHDYERASEFLSRILERGADDPELRFRSLIAAGADCRRGGG